MEREENFSRGSSGRRCRRGGGSSRGASSNYGPTEYRNHNPHRQRPTRMDENRRLSPNRSRGGRRYYNDNRDDNYNPDQSSKSLSDPPESHVQPNESAENIVATAVVDSLGLGSDHNNFTGKFSINVVPAVDQVDEGLQTTRGGDKQSLAPSSEDTIGSDSHHYRTSDKQHPSEKLVVEKSVLATTNSGELDQQLTAPVEYSSHGGESRTCYHCHQPGHVMRNCPNSGQQNLTAGYRTHEHRKCNFDEKAGGSRSGDSNRGYQVKDRSRTTDNNLTKLCHNCNQPGHLKRDCPQDTKPLYSNDRFVYQASENRRLDYTSNFRDDNNFRDATFQRGIAHPVYSAEFESRQNQWSIPERGVYNYPPPPPPFQASSYNAHAAGRQSYGSLDVRYQPAPVEAQPRQQQTVGGGGFSSGQPEPPSLSLYNSVASDSRLPSARKNGGIDLSDNESIDSDPLCVNYNNPRREPLSPIQSPIDLQNVAILSSHIFEQSPTLPPSSAIPHHQLNANALPFLQKQHAHVITTSIHNAPVTVIGAAEPVKSDEPVEQKETSPEPVAVPVPPKPSVDLYKVHNNASKKEQLRQLLEADEDNWTPTGEFCYKKHSVIFADSRMLADHLASYLRNVLLSSISAHLLDVDFEQRLKLFASGQHCALVSTPCSFEEDLFQDELKNVAQIDHVILHDLPRRSELWAPIFRLAGANKISLLFDPETEKARTTEFVQFLKDGEHAVPNWMQEYLRVKPVSAPAIDFNDNWD